MDDFFDASFIAELEELVTTVRDVRSGPAQVSGALDRKLAAFLEPLPGRIYDEPLTEDDFAELPAAAVYERASALLEACRQSHRVQAVQAVENFIVFFQALVPTLHGEGAAAIRRVFFRLVPNLIHIAYNDFAEADEKRADGVAALHSLESVLIEISNIRLAPSESDLVFRSIDQMTSFIGVGEYAMANEVISSQLLSIISRNKMTRALYRIMEVEVSIQNYLKGKLGYRTPQIRLPEDVDRLATYGPIRMFEEASDDDWPRRFIQIELPDIPTLRDVVLHLAPEDGSEPIDLRLDNTGTTALDLPDGLYQLGLVYQPENA